MKRKKRNQPHLRQSTRSRAEGDLSRLAGEPDSRREFRILIVVWLILATAMVLVAKENLSSPGLYYDEAVFAGMAKDCLTGQVRGHHMPGNEVTTLFGHPFPLFVQSYLGALKCWLLMPGFYFFGHTVPVMRSGNLFFGLIALLFFMLGTWRWLGLRIALLTGVLLAFDSTYFFLCVWDWGAAVSSFLCRSIAFYFAVIWWRRRQARYAFLASFFAGLAFFNKIDFAILLGALAIAALLCFGRSILSSLRTTASTMAFAAMGFLLGAGPILLKVPGILGAIISGSSPSAPGEFDEKIHTLWALYNGSYFYRMMAAGGVFEKMFLAPLNWLPIFGASVIIAAIACLIRKKRNAIDLPGRNIGLFLIVALVLTTIGVILLPSGTRIHHAILVYPLPQLLIATAATVFLKDQASKQKQLLLRAAAWIALLGLLLSQGWAIHQTKKLVRETGGRGWWSESFDAFCRENKNRTDLIIASLDWGFNEQLLFLTEGPQTAELFWDETLPELETEPHYLYLLHPKEYDQFPYNEPYLRLAQAKDPEVIIRPYSDRQNRVAFYTLQFPER